MARHFWPRGPFHILAERKLENKRRRLVSAELALPRHLGTGDGAVQTGQRDIHTVLAVAVILSAL